MSDYYEQVDVIARVSASRREDDQWPIVVAVEVGAQRYTNRLEARITPDEALGLITDLTESLSAVGYEAGDAA